MKRYLCVLFVLCLVTAGFFSCGDSGGGGDDDNTTYTLTVNTTGNGTVTLSPAELFTFTL